MPSAKAHVLPLLMAWLIWIRDKKLDGWGCVWNDEDGRAGRWDWRYDRGTKTLRLADIYPIDG